MNSMLNDTRPIYALCFQEEGARICVGSLGVTKIEVYEEPWEEYTHVWFAVWTGNMIWQRINGCIVGSIEYKLKEGA